jgi:hypothetical protein
MDEPPETGICQVKISAMLITISGKLIGEIVMSPWARRQSQYP